MFAALVPGAETTTLAMPAAWAGVVARILVSSTTVKSAGPPPIKTAVAPVKPLPLMTTGVPPAVRPLIGRIAVTVGMVAGDTV